MILFIDTSDYELAQIALMGESVVWHKFVAQNLSEQLLVEIKKFCGKQKVELSRLKKVAVVTGSGGFSRVRTAVATANALAFGLDILVVGFKKDQISSGLEKLSTAKGQKMVLPIYDKQPNITPSKNK